MFTLKRTKTNTHTHKRSYKHTLSLTSLSSPCSFNVNYLHLASFTNVRQLYFTCLKLYHILTYLLRHICRERVCVYEFKHTLERTIIPLVSEHLRIEKRLTKATTSLALAKKNTHTLSIHTTWQKSFKKLWFYFYNFNIDFSFISQFHTPFSVILFGWRKSTASMCIK